MPITVGPFTNTPAPGDPIRSPWAQQITHFVVDRIYCRFTRSPIAIPAGAVNTVIPLNAGMSNVQDPNAMISGSTIVIPTGYTGLWQVNVSWDIGSNGSSPKAIAGFVQRSDGARFGTVQIVAHATDGQAAGSAALIPMAAGQTLSFYGVNFATGATNLGIHHCSIGWVSLSPV